MVNCKFTYLRYLYIYKYSGMTAKEVDDYLMAFQDTVLKKFCKYLGIEDLEKEAEEEVGF